MLKFKLLFLVLFSSLFCSAQVSDYGRFITDTLASDAFKGRGYVEDGHNLAADFIAKEFKRFGLEEVNGSFYQYFYVNAVQIIEPLSLKLNKTVLTPGVDYLVDPSSPDASGKRKVTRVIFEDKMRINYSKPLNKKRALGIYFRSNDPRSEHGFVEGVKRADIKDGPIISTAKKLTWRISPEVSGKPHFIVLEELMPAKLKKVKYEINSEEKRIKTQNVMGMIKGSEQPDSFILVCGHYDHLGMMGKDAIFNGANDNASGIAIVLDMVKTWKEENYKPKYSILFVAFGAEEAGLVGSNFFVENPPIPIDKIRFVLNIDLMGTGGAGITVVNAPNHLDDFNILEEKNDKYQLLKIQKRANTQSTLR